MDHFLAESFRVMFQQVGVAVVWNGAPVKALLDDVRVEHDGRRQVVMRTATVSVLDVPARPRIGDVVVIDGEPWAIRSPGNAGSSAVPVVSGGQVDWIVALVQDARPMGGAS